MAAIYLIHKENEAYVRTPASAEVTKLLLAWGDGDEQALDRLLPLVHRELHDLARRYMAGERPGHTLQASALVNEAYLKLVDNRRVQWQNRAHFFGISAQLMRRILVDCARRRHYLKRGGGAQQVTLDEEFIVSPSESKDLVAIDDALKALEAFDARKARVVELRFFGGLSVDETAETLKISSDTVLRDWRLARAWLHGELNKGDAE
jgi:RNA polymerase sigma factor (TIGR02999 family)